MAETFAQLRALVARYRVQSAVIGVSIVAVVLFVAIGVRLRHAAEPLRLETTRLGATASELSAFRAAFVKSSPESDVRLSQLADSLGAAIARDNRVALAQQVAARAEAMGLTGVRVRFTPADSVSLPQHPAFFSAASYALGLDANGSLEDVLSLLGQLPSSVALERLEAARARGTTQFRLSFAVVEATERSSGTPLAQLMSFTKPPSESLPAAVVVARTASTSRDPFGAVVATQPVIRLAAHSVRMPPKMDAPAWDVTATLIAGTRRAALINGVLVSVGDAVAGGVTLTVVERDRVVLTDQKGAAHTIAVKEGER